MLDLTKSAKRTMEITLIDGQNLKLRMPTKLVFDALMGIGGRISSLKMDDAQTIDEIYALIAEILSNNLTHTEITIEYITSMLDFEDITTIFLAYRDFAAGVVKDPN